MTDLFYPTHPSIPRHWYIAPRYYYNATQNPITDTQKPVSGQEIPVRIAYGEQHLGAEIIWIGRTGTNWVFHLRWCLGPIWKITALDIDGDPLPASAVVTNYLGEPTQGVDPLLASLIPGYTDDLVFTGTGHGIAYSVVYIPYDDMPDSLGFGALVEAMVVTDTRTSSQVFTTNPALHAHDFLTSSLYGPGWTLLTSGTNACADRADELLSGQARYSSHMLLEKPAPLSRWVGMFLDAAGAYLVNNGNSFELFPDQPESSMISYPMESIILDRSERVRLIRRKDQPNVVRVIYTDTTVLPWREDVAVQRTAEVAGGTEYPIVSTIRAPYIHDHRVANRMAVHRLNYAQLTQYEITFRGQDRFSLLQRGDRATLDDLPGFAASQEVRILSAGIRAGEGGYYWNVLAQYYDPLIYSDEVVDRTTPPGPDVDDPEVPYPINGIGIVEVPWQDPAGTYQTQLRANWFGNNHAQTTSYRVLITSASGANVLDNMTVLAQGAQAEHSATSSPVEVGILYTIEVVAVSARGRPSLPYSVQYTPVGNALGAPAAVSIDSVIEAPFIDNTGATYSTIRIQWTGSADLWVRSYRVTVSNAAEEIWNTQVQHLGDGVTHVAVSPIVTQHIQYTVRLYTVNVEQDESVASPVVLTPQGRTVPPADVTGLDVVEYPDYIELDWDNVLGPGDISHRIKIGFVGDDWDSANIADHTIYMDPNDRAGPTVTFRSYEVEPGEVVYFVKAISFEGLESVNAASITIVIQTAKGSRGLDRPRPPTSIEDVLVFPDLFPSRLLIKEYRMGITQSYSFAEADDWQTIIDHDVGAGVLQVCLYGVTVANWVSGTFKMGLRIVMDGRIVYEVFNTGIVPKAGKVENYGLCPAGQIFLNPILLGGDYEIMGLSPHHIPFNRQLRIEAYAYGDGQMDTERYMGINWIAT